MSKKKPKKLKEFSADTIISASVSMSEALYNKYVQALIVQGMSFSKRVRGLIETDLEKLKSGK